MIVRRFVLPLAVCAMALMAGSAQAQNVFAPSGDDSSTSAAPLQPAPAPSDSSGQSGSVFAPSSPRSEAPRVQSQVPQMPQPVQPRPVPPGQRDEFVYRTMGLEVPANLAAQQADPLAGYTPEQIEIARKGFAAMEASNPEMAAGNPFRQIDAMSAINKAEQAMKARANAACDSQTVNIMVSPQSFSQTPGAAEGLAKTGVAMVGNLLQDICSDRELRAKFTSSVPMITIVNRARLAPNVLTTNGIITLSADFASEEAPSMAPIRAAFVKAIEDTDEFMNTTMQEATPQ